MRKKTQSEQWQKKLKTKKKQEFALSGYKYNF